MSSQDHLTPEFDRRLHRVADAFVGTMPEKEVADFHFLIDAGEPGVGLENFCTQLDEYHVPVDADVLRLNSAGPCWNTPPRRKVCRGAQASRDTRTE